MELLLVVFTMASTFAVVSAQDVPTLSFEGHVIRFASSERPYYSSHIPMFSLRATCVAMGSTVKRSRDSIHWTVIRSSDRLDCAFSDRWYIFNGARKELPTPPESRGDVLFVPFDLLDAFSGGTLELNADVSFHRVPEIIFRGRAIRYRGEDVPFRSAGTVYVSINATAVAIGAIVDARIDRPRLTITRSLDKVSYEQGQRSYIFNGAQKYLRSGSVVKGKSVFVPLELFQALVGDEIRSR